MNKFFSKKFKKILITFTFILFIFSASPAKAGIPVIDPGAIAVAVKDFIQGMVDRAKDYALKKAENLEETAASKAFTAALTNAMKKIAYDTATWIGSGGRGQEPLFIREDWGSYLRNIGDNAAGEFIENLGQNENFLEEFNLCQPDFRVKVKMGLGLTREYSDRPGDPICTFTEMRDNWEAELSRDDFLYRFNTVFNPGGNHLLQSFSLHSNIAEDIVLAEKEGELKRNETGGWLDIRNLAGERVSPPGQAEREIEAGTGALSDAIDTETEDPFIGAANVFINQLAYTAFQTALRRLGDGGKNSTSPYDWSSNLGNLRDFESGPNFGGISATKDRLTEFKNPNFSVRGDYNILGELTMCPDPESAGPTNCVITDKFRNAVEDKMTVGEALQDGHLSPDGVFGFKSNGFEPMYNEGYPYRSMRILRKFRIIPVGWELAAQYIKTSGETYTMADAVNCYSPTDDYGPHSSTGPSGKCLNLVGLVDPNWVLKAPLNYCKKEGPGPEILYENVISQGDVNRLTLSRSEDYCADEQTCIDENDDGSCNIYGYCTEEKRKWNFGTDSCDAKYNTCQTFKMANGSKISYLENTLDSEDCSIANDGCAEYYTEASSYSSSTNVVEWATGTGADLINFDNDASQCSSENEGCSQFIRTKAGQGVNLLPNSSFEDYDSSSIFDFWGNTVGSESSDSLDGQVSFNLPSATYSTSTPIGPPGHSAGGETFSLSLFAKGCGDNSVMSMGSSTYDIATSSFGASENWETSSMTGSFPESYSSNEIRITFSSATTTCLIDAVKLERGDNSTRYSEYMDNGVIYSKMIPDYLGEYCYEDFAAEDYHLAETRPLECYQYSRRCAEDELGCNIFKSLKDNLEVPAKVGAQDYCPDVCVGYDTYFQTETAFDSPQDQYFIPNTARSCSAQSAGCDQFTNLDRVEGGGESIEYYKTLKQCIKPSSISAPDECSNYYSWEGSKEKGYQLKVFTLQSDTSTSSPSTIDNYDDSAECNDEVYYASSTSSLYNPNCREYYADDGRAYYHLYTKVVSCSEDCHPYRRTEKNIFIDESTGANFTSTTSCVNFLNSEFPDANAANQFGYSTNGECVYCKDGGVWDSGHDSCIYNAVPGEGQTCSASGAGCREYSGNSGNNTRIILNNNFEGSSQSWTGDIGGISNESLKVGGNSLLVSGGNMEIRREMGYKIDRNNDYILSFVAKGVGGSGSVLDFRFENSAGTSTAFSATSSLDGAEWNIYKVNIMGLDHIVDRGESLVIRGSADFYIDDIRLTDIRDRYYLIKNSWTMPEVNGRDICDWDIINDISSPYYSLSCEQYSDKDNEIYSLRRFSNLCDETAVGCEIMIDTQNSDDYRADNLPDNGVSPTVAVPEDEYIYAVYNEDNLCNAQDEGCQRMGKGTSYENQILTEDYYIRNNPDEYETTICDETAVGCRAWEKETGPSAYFKDPLDQTCEWRHASEVATSSWGWFKTPVKRCDSDDSGAILTSGGENVLCLSADGCTISEDRVCFDNNDCSAGVSCIEDQNSYDCPTSPLKTFGRGGLANAVDQPSDDASGYWAGLCPAAQSGCTEYIDPISKFSTDYIFNGDFIFDYDSPSSEADGWIGGIQSVDLKPDTLYVLSVENVNTVTLNSPDNVHVLDEGNALNSTTTINISNSSTGERTTRLFYTDANDIFRVDIDLSSGDYSHLNGSVVSLKEAVVDYKINNFTEQNDCNGIVNFDEGCVLFNERSFSSGEFSGLGWDADAAFNDEEGVSPTGVAGENDSNILLNVNPDRECAKWLGCKSYIRNESGKNVCYDIGICDSLNENGNCDRFLQTDASLSEQIHDPFVNDIDFSNRTGYSKGAFFSSIGDFKEPNDYFKLGDMEQFGDVLYITNGSFEKSSSDGYPISWSNTADDDWIEQNYKIINDPVETQNEGIGRNPEGRGFLRLGPEYTLQSGYIDVSGGGSYVLSAYLNTNRINQGGARIRIEQYNASNANLNVPVYLEQDNGEAWTHQTVDFDVSLSASKIRLFLEDYGTPAPNGNFYFDDIKIRAALEAKTNHYVSQECRLYPESEALSCEYTEDTGAKQKGWYGYCLEHDSYPGNEDACLLWWPVDSPKGEGDLDKDNSAGYLGKNPVYLCDNVNVYVEPVEVREQIHLGRVSHSGYWIDVWGWFDDDSSTYVGSDACPSETGQLVNATNSGYEWRYTIWTSGSWKQTTTINYYCTPTGSVVAEAYDHDWYSYNGNLVNIEGADNGGHNEYEYGVKLYDHLTGKFYETDEYQVICDELHKVVTEDGQNKAWNGRVYSGSEYRTEVLDYEFSTDDAPFGSMVVPEPVHNPYEWDGNTKGGNQGIPLLSESSDKVRAGSPYDCDGIFCPQLGYCSVTGDLCYNVDQNVLTASDDTYYPECGTKTEQPCYYNWEQDFLPCPNGETCVTDDFNIDVEPKPESYENMKRIFAKSYGTWGWEPDMGYCEGSPTATCTPASDPCPGGTCEEACVTTLGGARVTAEEDDNVIEYTSGTRFCTNTADCESRIRHIDGDTISAFNASNNCEEIGNIYANAGAASTANCCDIASDPGCTAEAVADCQNYYADLFSATAPDNQICAGTGLMCLSNNDCHIQTSCELAECVGGDRPGSMCNTPQLCVNDRCIYEEINSGRYMQTDANSWDVPLLECPTNPRPDEFAYDPPTYGLSTTPTATNPTDYCAIPPLVNDSNIKINDSEPTSVPTDVVLRNGQIANLTFTSQAEVNQEPLVAYSIYWDGAVDDDSDSTFVSGVRMNSRPDPNNPHSVYHLYSYYDLRQKEGEVPGTSIECGDDCSADAGCSVADPGYDGPYCRTKPLIQVRDNWGWCNDGFSNNICPPTSYTEFDADVYVKP